MCFVAARIEIDLRFAKNTRLLRLEIIAVYRLGVDVRLEAEKHFPVGAFARESLDRPDRGQLDLAFELPVEIVDGEAVPGITHVGNDEPVPRHLHEVDHVFALGNDFAPVFPGGIVDINGDHAAPRCVEVGLHEEYRTDVANRIELGNVVLDETHEFPALAGTAEIDPVARIGAMIHPQDEIRAVVGDERPVAEFLARVVRKNEFVF